MIASALPTAMLLSVALNTAGVGDTSSRTVIGANNSFLADGSQALVAGDFAEGVRLTEIGLRFAKTDKQRADALSNLCAGLIKMEQFELALERCNESIELKPTQWRAYSNRANVLLHLGRVEEAEASLTQGLEINPNSYTLKRVLDAAREMRYRTKVSISDKP